MRTAPALWIALRASFWFVPSLVLAASVCGAALMVEVDALSQADLAAWSPRLFGAGVDGSRAMLSAIACYRFLRKVPSPTSGAMT